MSVVRTIRAAGQLTYTNQGLSLIVDLGKWWFEDTGGLPLPLGGSAIRRDLGREVMQDVTDYFKRSIQYGLDHREETLAYAIQFSRGLDTSRADRFVGMYVNELTLDYGVEGREAVRRLLTEAYEKKIIPTPVQLDFV